MKELWDKFKKENPQSCDDLRDEEGEVLNQEDYSICGNFMVDADVFIVWLEKEGYLACETIDEMKEGVADE